MAIQKIFIKEDGTQGDFWTISSITLLMNGNRSYINVILNLWKDQETANMVETKPMAQKIFRLPINVLNDEQRNSLIHNIQNHLRLNERLFSDGLII